MNRSLFLAALAATLAGTATASPVPLSLAQRLLPAPALPCECEASPPAAPEFTPDACLAFASAPDPGATGASADAAPLDALIAALYAGVSYAPGEVRDPAALQALFVPDARVFVTRAGPGGRLKVDAMDVAGFSRLNQQRLAGRGFYEREVHREQTRYGGVVHAWSVFEARRAPDAAPFARGANTLQLVDTDAGWRIAAITWELETPRRPLAARFPVPALAPEGLQ